MLNQNTTISAHHHAKHFAMLFGVSEQLTAESEYPVVNAATVGECFALPFFQGGSEPFKTADQEVFHVVEMPVRSEEHTSELQSPCNLVCRLLLEKKKKLLHNLYPSELDVSSYNYLMC